MDVLFPEDKQPDFIKITRAYTDTSTDGVAHFLEIEGGPIYPGQEKTISLRGFECRTDMDWNPARQTVKLILHADPTPIIRGDQEMPMILEVFKIRR
jgi:hypothetical protein